MFLLLYVFTYFNLFQVKSQYPEIGYCIVNTVMKMYKRIRDLREDKDLNQTQIAKTLKMSQTGYSKYETGENDIPTHILISLADFYNVSVDYILGRTDNPNLNK